MRLWIQRSPPDGRLPSASEVNRRAPRQRVTDETGRRIPLGTKAALGQSFRRELELLAADRPLRRRMSRAGHEYTLGRYSWDVKARKLMEVYEWVLGRRAQRPCF